MSLLSLVASLGLIAVSACKVVPKPAPNVTVYHKDLLQFNVSDIFSYGANVTCDSFGGSIAEYFTPSTEIATKDISNFHFGDEPEVVQFVSNTSVFAVFDNSQVLIQPINLDHESFGTPISKNFGRPGAEAICTDVAFNKKTNRIFISCFAKQSVMTANSTLWIYELNGDSGDTVGHYTTTLDDDKQKIVHRANVMLVPIKRGANLELGVIVYDQGISSGLVDNNKWVWVLSGADSDALGDHGVIDLSGALKLTSVYDIFGLRDGLLVTGKNSSVPNDMIRLAWCQLSLAGQVTVSCNDQLVTAPFNTSTGYVGIFNTGQYVEVNADLTHTEYDMISVCNFNDAFGTPNFIDTKACAVMPSYKIPDNVSISVVEGNVHQLVVQYVHFDSTYAGFSLHNFDLRWETNHIDDSLAHHLVPLGKSIVKVNKTDLAIHRMVPPFFFVKADDLADGFNSIRIECKDAESMTPVPNFINITKLTSMTDGVYLNHDKIPDFSVYDGGRFMFQLDSDMMMGNDLSVQVTFDAAVAPFAVAQVYDTEFVNINWRVTNTSVNFQDIHFSGKFAVTLDVRGWIAFHRCRFIEIAALECQEQASYNLAGHNVVLKKDVNAVFGWMFAWAYDSDVNTTFIFIFDGKQINVHYRPGTASDCAMTEVGEFAYQVCAYAATGEVRGFQYSQLNPQVGIPMPTINVAMSGRDYFCPIDVDFDPQLGYVLEVLSVCPGKDQRIIRYRYPPGINFQTGELELRLISSIPLNFAFQDPQYCSMGTEFVVYSNVNGKRGDIQSYNIVDDLNSWNFGTLFDDLNLGDIKDFNCIPRAGVFTTVSADPNDPTKVSLAVYWGNNQWQANHKVYNTRRDGLDQYKFIDSYEFMGQVIHTLYEPSSHTFDFMLSFTKGPLVDVRFEKGAVKAVDAKGTVGMQINIRNMRKMIDTITKRVEIVDAASTVKVITKKKITANSAGIIDLEDYIQIKGPVADAVIHNVTSGVHLIGRLHSSSLYKPSERDQGVFTHLETFGSTSVGVKTSQSNTSIFTIFHYIDNYVGQYTPAHGVNAFHFAPLASDPDNSILVAYSSAEPTNNSLQIVVIKGADRIAIGMANSSTPLNFSMVRVIPLATTEKDSFLVLGMNGDEHSIHHFLVTVSNGRVTVVNQNVVADVHDFSFASPSAADSIFVIYNVQGDFKHVMIEAIDKKSGQPKATQRLPVDLSATGLKDDFVDYQVMSLFARVHNDTAFYVVFNTNSPYIFEYIYDTKNNFQNPAHFKYMKMPGHDGRYMDGNKQNFVMLTMGDIQSGDAGARYIVYTRQCQTNNGSVFPTWSMYNDVPRPFTLTNCKHNMSHFQFATAFDAIPVAFLYIAPMQLNVTDASQLANAVLEIDAAAHVQSLEIKFADIIDGGGDDKKALPWWPFALVIGILVLAALGFIINNIRIDHQRSTRRNPKLIHTMS